MNRTARAWLLYLIVIVCTFCYDPFLGYEVTFITLWIAMLIWQTQDDWKQSHAVWLRLSKIFFMWAMMLILGAGLLMTGTAIIPMFVFKSNEQATAQRMQAIVAAMFRYDQKHGYVPIDSTEKDGQPLLSWRVHLLPFLGEQLLYEQFRLNEPWNSVHNAKLLQITPPCYRMPAYTQPVPGGYTVFQVVAEPGAFFEKGSKRSLADLQVADGPAHTILLAIGHHAVPWTKPADLEKPVSEIKDLGFVHDTIEMPVTNREGHLRRNTHQSIMLVTADGHSHRVPPWRKEFKLKPFITWKGGETVLWEYD